LINLGLSRFAWNLRSDHSVGLIAQRHGGLTDLLKVGKTIGAPVLERAHHYLKRYHERQLPFSSAWLNLDAEENPLDRIGACLGQNGCKLVCGWNFRFLKGLEEKAEIVRARLLEYFDLQGITKEPIIGLHVRLTDFRTWHNGRFYFSKQLYCDWLRQAMARFGRGYGYMIVGDDTAGVGADGGELVGRKRFRALDETNDLLNLMRCSVVIGPPSTYSTMAAFLGGSELLLLDGKQTRVSEVPLLANPLLDMHGHPEGSLAVN
jgi:hypothetical protein